MKTIDTAVFAKALSQTMSSIKEGTPSSTKHRVTLDGKMNALGSEWELRQYIEKNWTRLEGRWNERFISPCGKFRSLVIDTGCVMITTWPVTPGAVVYVEYSGMGGSWSGRYEQDS